MLIVTTLMRSLQVGQSPQVVVFSILLAWTIGWIAWWPLFKPAISFGWHVAIGVVSGVLVLSVASLLLDAFT